MTNDEIVERLRVVLAPTIAWYRRVLDEGEPDGSFLYDEAIEHLSACLSRGAAQELIEVLL